MWVRDSVLVGQSGAAGMDRKPRELARSDPIRAIATGSDVTAKEMLPTAKGVTMSVGISSRRWSVDLGVVSIAALGVVLSVGLFLTLRRWERQEQSEHLTGLVRERVETLRISLLRSMEVLHSLASLHAADEEISRDRFSKFVRAALERQPELLALSWNPVVPDDRRSEIELALRREGGGAGHFRELNERGEAVPAVRRPEYVPVRYIEPFDRNAAALGYDLNSDPRRKITVERARDSGESVATAPIRLAQDRTEHGGFLVLLPVYRRPDLHTLDERRHWIAGYAVAVFRLADLVGPSFEFLNRHGIEVSLRDETPDDLATAAGSEGPPGDQGEECVVPLDVTGRRLVVHARAQAGRAGGAKVAQSWLGLVSGLLLTGLGASYLMASRRHSFQMAAANASLREEVRERQRAEQAAAAASKAKSDFLACMSHEIRTPLNAILGYAQLLQRDLNLAPEQLDNLAGIRTSGQHLLGLVNEILDLSKIEAGRMEVHDAEFELSGLVSGLESTFRPLCAQQRIGFRLALDAGARRVRVRGDEGKLRQILINLIGNAVKFTGAGEVVLQIRRDGLARWRFDVTDTGQGIPAGEQADIFKPFHQGTGSRGQGGTGLGLAIAERQVQLLGGELRVESERGRGSRFYFSISLGVSADADLFAGPAGALETDHAGFAWNQATEAVSGAGDQLWSAAGCPVDLPVELQTRLGVAAELHSTTALKACLQELRHCGPEAVALADQIRHLMRSFDMDGIQRLLARATGNGPILAGSPAVIHAHGARRD